MDEDMLLQRAVDRIVGVLKAKVVILFGSRARGDWVPWSDYDLLIIADFREGYLDRMARVLDVVKDIPLPIEPHPYRFEEAVEMLKRGNPTLVDSLEEGRVLYAEERYISELMRIFEKLKERGLRRSETSIILPDTDEL